MKKIMGNKPIWVIIHIYMEISQGNSLCSYLYLKLKKCHFFFFLLENRRTGMQNRSCLWWGEGVGTSGRGEKAGKRVGG
jgi:hypothetical protein